MSYVSQYENNSILQPLENGKLNGRVNILEPPPPNVVFQMQEKIAIKNKSTEYRDPLAGIWEDNLLAKLYFSKENVQIIQNGLRAGVYNMSNNEFVIAPQNVDTLKIIMRSIYLQHAANQFNNISQQIFELNNMVLEYCVQQVYSEAQGYMKYINDVSTLVVPIAHPIDADNTDRVLEFKKWF